MIFNIQAPYFKIPLHYLCENIKYSIEINILNLNRSYSINDKIMEMSDCIHEKNTKFFSSMKKYLIYCHSPQEFHPEILFLELLYSLW